MQQEDLVTLTIDGREVSVPRGSTVLQAARKLGIDIPTFCYSPKMDPLGACRMCLVSIERVKGFPPSCATPVAPGMVVRTVTPDVVKTQQGILEFLLINHPLDCPICDKGGECPLQNNTFKFGPGKSRYTEEKRHFVKHMPIGPQIVLDRERCIVCQLCVRFMDDVADDPQIVLMSRGGKTEINVFPDRPFDSPFAGNTIELCPVGALTSREYRFRARPWDLAHTPSICPSCAVGCNVTLDTRRGDLLRLVSRDNPAVDDGWLCDEGRFGTLDRLHAGEPVTAPRIRRNGVLEECSWEEALAAAARGLERATGSVAALAGAQATNEELYLLGKLVRAALRSGDIAVRGASPSPTAVLGGGAIADLETADAIVLVDANPVARQPVLDLRIKKQIKRRQTPLVILSNEQTGLDYLARARAPFAGTAPQHTLERLVALLQSGEPVDGEPLAAAARVLAGSRRGVVLYDERLLTAEQGVDLLAAVRALAAALSGAAETAQRPLALAAAANSRGAPEMGAHGAWLAGGAALSDAAAAAKIGAAWGRQPVTAAGRSVPDILAAARAGSLGALFLLQDDPVADGGGDALQALDRVPFIVLQTARATASMEYADVVLPAAPYGKTPGTFTNTEGRVQRLFPASVPEEPVHPGWQILADLTAALGVPGSYLAAEDVTQEIARVTGLPSWAPLLIQALEPVAVGGAR